MTDPQYCHLKLAGFELIVLGRQFPDSHDVWDGNWLNVVCNCQDARLKLKATGPFLTVGEIMDLLDKLKQANEGEISFARVEIIEPELNLFLSVTSDKQILLQADLQPEGKRQSVRFEFKLNQAEIQAAIEQCQIILQTYPMRGI
jgi:hypothetical protein